jgi:hypothetical protein
MARKQTRRTANSAKGRGKLRIGKETLRDLGPRGDAVKGGSGACAKQFMMKSKYCHITAGCEGLTGRAAGSGIAPMLTDT